MFVTMVIMTWHVKDFIWEILPCMLLYLHLYNYNYIYSCVRNCEYHYRHTMFVTMVTWHVKGLIREIFLCMLLYLDKRLHIPAEL